jgi:hypothetical protein
MADMTDTTRSFPSPNPSLIYIHEITNTKFQFLGRKPTRAYGNRESSINNNVQPSQALNMLQKR